MKAIILLWVCVWLTGAANAQPPRGHYDVVSVNEAIQGDGYVVSIMSWERQKVEITVEKLPYTPLEIRVRAADRQVICSDKAVRLDQLYRRVLNLSQLESGRYWLEIQVGKQVIRRELRLESADLTYRSLTLH
ncbi:MAG: hypothetical protein H7Z72_02485 [Bacteroidetes bacterium]|nr:hypothetical protein [Fibrella sp.]